MREEKTSSSDMEAIYSFRFRQKWREVIVYLKVLCEMKSTRFWAYALWYLSGITLYIGRANTQIIPHRPLRRMSRTSRSILEWNPLTMATLSRFATSVAQSRVSNTESEAILLDAKKPIFLRSRSDMTPSVSTILPNGLIHRPCDIRCRNLW